MQENKEEATDKKCGSLLAEEEQDEQRFLERLAAYLMRFERKKR
jgi:hypothetical protein